MSRSNTTLTIFRIQASLRLNLERVLVCTDLKDLGLNGSKTLSCHWWRLTQIKTMEDGKSFGAEKQGKPCRKLMNKFSSLSTSVLLALLTSSFSAAAYADGNDSLSRVPQRSNHDTMDRQQFAGTNLPNRRTEEDTLVEESLNVSGQDDTAVTAAIKPWTADEIYNDGALPVVSINGEHATLLANNVNHLSSVNGSSADAILSATADLLHQAQAEEEEEQVATSSTSTATAVATDSNVSGAEDNTAVAPANTTEDAPVAALSSDLVQSQSDSAPNVGHTPLSMTRTFHSLQLNLGQNPQTLPAGEPSQLDVAFEHPSDFKESFIVAGDTTVLSYSNEQGSFAISFKLRPLDLIELQQLNFTQFKDRLTARFSDKSNMLYGEYTLLHAYANAKEALEAHAIHNAQPVTSADSGNSNSGSASSLVALPVGPNDLYMDLSFSAFLKKSQDGILPDMQNFFYERNILNRGYLATLSCEFRGTQAQASMIRYQFETFSPLCDRILKSYSFTFKAPAFK